MFHDCTSNDLGFCGVCYVLGTRKAPPITGAVTALAAIRSFERDRITDAQDIMTLWAQARTLSLFKVAAKVGPMADVALNAATPKALAVVHSKLAPYQGEIERAQGGADRRDEKAKAKAAKAVARRTAEFHRLAGLRGSQERAWTVRVKFTNRVATVTMVRVNAPNPHNVRESKAALKMRQDVVKVTGMTATGDLPGLRYVEAERLADTLRTKLPTTAPTVSRKVRRA